MPGMSLLGGQPKGGPHPWCLCSVFTGLLSQLSSSSSSSSVQLPLGKSGQLPAWGSTCRYSWGDNTGAVLSPQGDLRKLGTHSLSWATLMLEQPQNSGCPLQGPWCHGPSIPLSQNEDPGYLQHRQTSYIAGGREWLDARMLSRVLLMDGSV